MREFFTASLAKRIASLALQTNRSEIFREEEPQVQSTVVNTYAPKVMTSTPGPHISTSEVSAEKGMT